MDKDTTVKILEIPLEAELVDIYHDASPSDQLKIRMLPRLWIREISIVRRTSLSEVINRVSAEAQTNGLTPEILAEILAEDE
jgi:hypothetical protein